MSETTHDNENEYLSGWEKIHSIEENPFNVEAPYEWIVTLEAEGRIHGAVLDAGCAAGHNTLYLAAKGYDCVGVDISPTAIQRAQEKADAQKMGNATFRVANISKTLDYENIFDTVIDIGCFHSLHEDDQKRYADVLKSACKADAQIHLRTLNAVNAPGPNPAQTQERQIRAAFANGWRIDSLGWKTIEEKLSPDRTMMLDAWFVHITKLGS